MKKVEKLTLLAVTLLCSSPFLCLFGTLFYIAYDWANAGW